jgi:hypothetical protein
MEAGKITETWGFAGGQGGGEIIEVDSLEEMDVVVGSFPFIAFSEMQVLPLVDVFESIGRAKELFRQMGPPR